MTEVITEEYLLPATYKILSSILVSRLTPNVGKFTGVHQFGFQCRRKKWEYNETVN
jgi:hypothetical protein